MATTPACFTVAVAQLDVTEFRLDQPPLAVGYATDREVNQLVGIDAPDIIRPVLVEQEVAAEAGHIGDRLARLAALNRVSGISHDGRSPDDLSHLADTLRTWADYLAEIAPGKDQSWAASQS